MARNYFIALKSKYKYADNNGHLITIPGQAITIPEIIRRFQKGIPVDQRPRVYSQDPINYDGLDLTEITHLSEINEAKIADLEAQLNHERSEQERIVEEQRRAKLVEELSQKEAIK